MPAGNILVADDDAAIRTVLNQALSRAGYEVRSTSNAATLWRWVSHGEGDLVITDVVMPDENAFDLLPRIKKLRPELRVLAPVKAPFSWPNNSDSMRSRGIAAMLMATNGPLRRLP